MDLGKETNLQIVKFRIANSSGFFFARDWTLDIKNFHENSNDLHFDKTDG